MSAARCRVVKKSSRFTRIVFVALAGIIFGFYAGLLYPYAPLAKAFEGVRLIRSVWTVTPKALVSEDLNIKPKYLVVFTVGLEQREDINAAVEKFSADFQILLFHYDGCTSEWDRYEWSRNAIHVSTRKQTKWWYAKRFLHPDVVAAYDYIFLWDEDLGVEHFNAQQYIQLIKRYGLEISQPGIEPNDYTTWPMTERRVEGDVHKASTERPGLCKSPNLPPCAAFVEIMAPVFSRKAWRCVWHMIQNDLVHGWGLDFAFRRCVHPANEKMGVVDSQWVVHKMIPSLWEQGISINGSPPWEAVRNRCSSEWSQFRSRLSMADEEYHLTQAQ